MTEPKHSLSPEELQDPLKAAPRPGEKRGSGGALAGGAGYPSGRAAPCRPRGVVRALFCVMAFATRATRNAGVVRGGLQSVAELANESTAGLLRDIVGGAGRPFSPSVSALFCFLLAGILPGMVPYSFPYTSHI